jgi:hypothetical protein
MAVQEHTIAFVPTSILHWISTIELVLVTQVGKKSLQHSVKVCIGKKNKGKKEGESNISPLMATTKLWHDKEGGGRKWEGGQKNEQKLTL